MEILGNTITALVENDTRSLLELANKINTDSEAFKTMVTAESSASLSKTFSDKEVIADKAVDVFLNSFIAMKKIGLDDGTIDNLIRAKLTNWSGEVHESVAKYPFEIHITAEIPKDEPYENYIEKFAKTCSDAKVKPIMLDLQSQSNEHVMNDATTSSKIFGTEKEAFHEVERICNCLESYNFHVIRKKIETAIWYEKAQSKDLENGNYFECHVGLLIPENNYTESMNKLSELCKKHSAHLSRNTMKRADSGNIVQMATIRTYESPNPEQVSHRKFFENHIEAFANDLTESGFEYEKLVYEFALYDTRNSHDKAWLDSSKAA
ncbi:hypothetical protein TRFO_01915 [Tritrichomonas foetus]|uniref:Uncharacterized protein n=1 Tax=Tritrichomonas foetus TaxID=1144522 RepID=A0A1J4JMS3_9EUKA|nr:hypothetical protein TRFO_01915 [Tritrichomonas foetus]|eukprot:OHS98835.1 hypothetical protein TRFO_01915 [Tritrichomonas foetus]